jgi:hypothetical protein
LAFPTTNPHSLVRFLHQMASPNSDSYDGHVRKRVGKACDRCRLKKSKVGRVNLRPQCNPLTIDPQSVME